MSQSKDIDLFDMDLDQVNLDEKIAESTEVAPADKNQVLIKSLESEIASLEGRLKEALEAKEQNTAAERILTTALSKVKNQSIIFLKDPSKFDAPSFIRNIVNFLNAELETAKSTPQAATNEKMQEGLKAFKQAVKNAEEME